MGHEHINGSWDQYRRHKNIIFLSSSVPANGHAIYLRLHYLNAVNPDFSFLGNTTCPEWFLQMNQHQSVMHSTTACQISWSSQSGCSISPIRLLFAEFSQSDHGSCRQIFLQFCVAWPLQHDMIRKPSPIWYHKSLQLCQIFISKSIFYASRCEGYPNAKQKPSNWYWNCCV